MSNNTQRLVILSSGIGSNLQAMIDTLHDQDGITIAAVVSDKPSPSLKRASQADIPCDVIPQHKKQSNTDDDKLLDQLIQLFHP